MIMIDQLLLHASASDADELCNMETFEPRWSTNDPCTDEYCLLETFEPRSSII